MLTCNQRHKTRCKLASERNFMHICRISKNAIGESTYAANSLYLKNYYSKLEVKRYNTIKSPLLIGVENLWANRFDSQYEMEIKELNVKCMGCCRGCTDCTNLLFKKKLKEKFRRLKRWIVTIVYILKFS